MKEALEMGNAQKNAAAKLIDPNDCVLVVIDVQEKLLNVMTDKEWVLDNAIILAKFATTVGMPVVATEQEKLGPTVLELSDEIAGFSPIMKLDFDAGKRPEFLEALEKTGKKTVLICGIESHICVTQTVLHLLPDYNVHVISDACGARAPANKVVAMDRMREAGAVISSTEMVIYEVLEVAGTPEFKQCLQLIK